MRQLKPTWARAIAALDVAGLRGTSRGELTPTRVAAWTVVARVLLNLDETITKE